MAKATSITHQEKTWATLVHVSAFLGVIIPFTHIIAPFLIWIIKKEEMPFVNEHGKEAVNFQISMTIYFFVSFILMMVLIGFLTSLALAIFEIVVIIKASIAANKGESYRYPLSIRFIK